LKVINQILKKLLLWHIKTNKKLLQKMMN